jgi:hypothetical protein
LLAKASQGDTDEDFYHLLREARLTNTPKQALDN